MQRVWTTGFVLGGAASGYFVGVLVLPLIAILAFGVYEDHPRLWDSAAVTGLIGALGGGWTAWRVLRRNRQQRSEAASRR